ncbi:MAG: hypothetical protein K0R41_576 [Geminicoccaceae bacterium]|jgi:hypothetical protein|nr:hypothetical protein [Geminicoccaceae bacterium]
MTEQANSAQPATPATEQQTPTYTVQFRGAVLDYRHALPLKAGDWRRLKQKHNFDIMAMGAKAARAGGGVSLDDIFILARVVLEKATGTPVTDEELDDLTFADLQAAGVAAVAAEGAKIKADPTSTSSSALPNGGAGVTQILAP